MSVLVERNKNNLTTIYNVKLQCYQYQVPFFVPFLLDFSTGFLGHSFCWSIFQGWRFKGLQNVFNAVMSGGFWRLPGRGRSFSWFRPVNQNTIVNKLKVIDFKNCKLITVSIHFLVVYYKYLLSVYLFFTGEGLDVKSMIPLSNLIWKQGRQKKFNFITLLKLTNTRGHCFICVKNKY